MGRTSNSKSTGLAAGVGRGRERASLAKSSDLLSISLVSPMRKKMAPNCTRTAYRIQDFLDLLSEIFCQSFSFISGSVLLFANAYAEVAAGFNKRSVKQARINI